MPLARTRAAFGVLACLFLVWEMWSSINGAAWTFVQRFETEAECGEFAQAYVKGQTGVQVGCGQVNRVWRLRAYVSPDGISRRKAWSYMNPPFDSKEACERSAAELQRRMLAKYDERVPMACDLQ